MISFPHPGENFLTFYASCYNVQFILLGVSGIGSESFGGQGGLLFLLLSQPLVHVCFLTSMHGCAMLCFPSIAYSQHPEQGHLSQKSPSLPPLWPAPSHCFSQMSLPGILAGSVAVCPSVFGTCTQPCPWCSGSVDSGHGLCSHPCLTGSSVVLWSSQQGSVAGTSHEASENKPDNIFPLLPEGWLLRQVTTQVLCGEIINS